MKREDVLALLGKKGMCTLPPALEIISEKNAEGYAILTVSYTASDDETVKALLLVPDSFARDGSKRYPLIIAHHQHGARYDAGMLEPAGLCENPANTFALTLVKAGNLVFVPEQLGFGERRAKYPDGRFMDGKDNERWHFIQLYLHGRTYLGKCLFDLSKALDAILTLPYVDAERIGICGHSMGGLIAYWFGWYEKRVKAIFSSCGFSSLTLLQKEHLNHTFTMYLPGLLEIGDTPELSYQIFPKPLFLTFGAQDRIFPAYGTRKICSDTASFYKEGGKADCFYGEVTDDGHVFTMEKQQKAVDFFKTWL